MSENNQLLKDVRNALLMPANRVEMWESNNLSPGVTVRGLAKKLEKMPDHDAITDRHLKVFTWSFVILFLIALLLWLVKDDSLRTIIFSPIAVAAACLMAANQIRGNIQRKQYDAFEPQRKHLEKFVGDAKKINPFFQLHNPSPALVTKDFSDEKVQNGIIGYAVEVLLRKSEFKISCQQQKDWRVITSAGNNITLADETFDSAWDSGVQFGYVASTNKLSVFQIAESRLAKG